MPDTKAFIERLRAATGPDRGLSFDIERAYSLDPEFRGDADEWYGGARDTHLTASFENAVAFADKVLGPGQGGGVRLFSLQRLPVGTWRCALHSAGATPAIALAICALEQAEAES